MYPTALITHVWSEALNQAISRSSDYIYMFQKIGFNDI